MRHSGNVMHPRILLKRPDNVRGKPIMAVVFQRFYFSLTSQCPPLSAPMRTRNPCSRNFLIWRSTVRGVLPSNAANSFADNSGRSFSFARTTYFTSAFSPTLSPTFSPTLAGAPASGMASNSRFFRMLFPRKSNCRKTGSGILVLRGSHATGHCSSPAPKHCGNTTRLLRKYRLSRQNQMSEDI